jgi:hypothetical protein
LTYQILWIYFGPESSLHCFGMNSQFNKWHQIFLRSSWPELCSWSPFLRSIFHIKPLSFFDQTQEFRKSNFVQNISVIPE